MSRQLKGQLLYVLIVLSAAAELLIEYFGLEADHVPQEALRAS